MTTIFRHKLSYQEYEQMEPWGRRIMVENVPKSESVDSLLTSFGQFGLIVELTYMPQDNLAFVVYTTKSAAVLAIEKTESLGFTSGNPRKPTNSTPAKDVAAVVLKNTYSWVTAAGLRAWMDRVNDRGAVTSVSQEEDGSYVLRFRAHYLAYRFVRKIGEQKINLNMACGLDATVGWPEIPILKVTAVPTVVNKQQIKNAFRRTISDSITHIAQRGYTNYIYFSNYSSYKSAYEDYPNGITLVANGSRASYKLIKLEKQSIPKKQ